MHTYGTVSRSFVRGREVGGRVCQKNFLGEGVIFYPYFKSNLRVIEVFFSCLGETVFSLY